jgi:hypothetical protein
VRQFLVLIFPYEFQCNVQYRKQQKGGRENKRGGGMYASLLEVLHYLFVYKNPCTDIDFNNICCNYAPGRNL